MGMIFIQGGFEQKNPSQPVSDVYSIDLFRALQKQPEVVSKLERFLADFGSPHPSASNSNANTPERFVHPDGSRSRHQTPPMVDYNQNE